MIALSKIEMKLLEFVHEYMKNHGKLNLGEIVNYCYIKFDGLISKQQIEENLRKLFEKRYYIKEIKALNGSIFENEIRKRIMNYIQRNPGVYNRKIRNDLRIHSNEFEWHIKMLERFGFIKKVKFFNRQFGYFENRSYMGHEFDLFLLQNSKVQKIIEALKRKSRLSISQLSELLGIHYTTIKKYILQLFERDIVIEYSSKDSSRKLYGLNKEMYVKLRKIRNGQVFIEFAE